MARMGPNMPSYPALWSHLDGLEQGHVVEPLVLLTERKRERERASEREREKERERKRERESESERESERARE